MGAIEPAGTREVVERMARALDADDFESARALLADDCVYDTGRERRRGPEEIIQSYAAASAWAHKVFDEVRYESTVESVVGATGAVRFTDYVLKAGGPWHRHRCRQEFTVGPVGRIVRIVHHEIAGEREKVDAFLAACGIQR